jgi:hypothetical protein
VYLVIYASGYPSVFANDAQEIASLKAGTWSPQTQDFRAAATRSGLALPAASLDNVIRQIGTQKAGSIDKLGIIAHSNKTMIGLAGHILLVPGGDVLFTQAGIIDASMLSSKAAQIATILDRFADKASIVLFSCNSGTDLSLVIQFQTAFGLDCYGFNDEVGTCTTWTTPANNKITVRGRMAYTDPNSSFANLVATGQADPCTFAKNTVWELQPDMGFFSRN